MSVFVLPTLAPLAHLIALLLTRIPQLVSYSTGGDALSATIEQAHEGTQHALLLGAAAGFTAALAGRWAVRGPGTATTSRRRLLLHAAAVARGPAGSIGRRIGSAMTTGLMCCLLLTMLDSQPAQDAVRHLAAPWCTGSQLPSMCADQIAGVVLKGLPHRANTTATTLWNVYPLILLYAYLTCFSGALLVDYVLRTLAGLRARRSTLPLLFVRTWAAYLVGATLYGTVLEAAITLWTTPWGGRAHGLAARESLVFTNFLYSPGLYHSLLAAPAAAALTALAALLIRHATPRRARPTPTASPG